MRKLIVFVLVIYMFCEGCSKPKIEVVEVPMTPINLITKVRSGVAQIILVHNNKSISFGSAFLVEGGLVTNSHNIRSRNFDTIAIRFADSNPSDKKSYIYLSREERDKIIAKESIEDEKDYVYLKLTHPKFKGRHVFEFTDSSNLSVGEQVVFLGFPFGMNQMTAHIGYVSSIYEENGVEKIQIDGSVNGGNSGGPLLDIKSGKVAGIVTQANVGFAVKQFDDLIKALQHNQRALEGSQVTVSIGGINPIEALKASQAAMEQIAKNLRQSANVGIGYAYSSNYVRDDIMQLLKK